jgi:Fe-S-cluster containining protein
MIVVTNEEANKVSKALQITRKSFDQEYLEKGGFDLMLMNSMPCSFLKDNSCTIYEHRFEGCREFPALHLNDFKKKLFSHFMHYSRCPIIFNVIEQLKIELRFELNDTQHD